MDELDDMWLYLNKAVKENNFDVEILMFAFFKGLLFFNISCSIQNTLLSGQ